MNFMLNRRKKKSNGSNLGVYYARTNYAHFNQLLTALLQM